MADLSFCQNCFEKITDEKCPKCGWISKAESDEPLALPPGTILNNTYKIGRVLGAGGFGITYKAQDINTKMIVAVKEYVPMNMVYRDFSNNHIEIKMGKQQKMYNDGLLSFVEEANFLVLLKNSSHIVNIYNCFNENNTAYFAMEFIDGYTLDNVQSMDINYAYDCMINTIDALKIVHSKGIIHRDISPQNIFYTSDKKIKLIDFGNARFKDKGSMNDERLILKPGYAPPELYMKENVQGPWTDIYSLAATFYRLSTNIKLPNALERINGKAIVPMRHIFPNMSHNLEMAINRALELDYDKRPQSVYEFLEDIENTEDNNSDYTEFYDSAVTRSTAVNAQPNNAAAVRQNEKKPIFSGFIKDISAKRAQAQRNRAMAAAPQPQQPARQTPAAPKTVAARRVLQAFILAYDGRKYPLSEMRSTVIGRDFNTSHIVINDSGVSRKHCVVECSISKREFYVTDWSSNGTFAFNNSKIGYGTKFTLKPGSEFYVYSSKYTFKVVME